VLPSAVPGKVQLHPDTQAHLKTGKLTGHGTDAVRRLPRGWGDPADIAAAVLYLVGPSGRYMAGQSITLDGECLIS
jgi:NAD(P)-dependent dehydrogenase (short-subunit alcohol dehydrogenase family)